MDCEARVQARQHLRIIKGSVSDDDWMLLRDLGAGAAMTKSQRRPVPAPVCCVYAPIVSGTSSALRLRRRRHRVRSSSNG